ncbi:replication initiation protein, partial [Oceanobacillus picturae]|uniref:replication initiation protein n=1 Tax=Oceanobacillus picturae TaxID=171693 RepID=UPI000569CA84
RENSIKKSNDLSMAKLSQGLTLNQMQLLAYAIYSTQQDGKTEFIKADFEKKFNIEKYRTKDAYEDSDKILGLKVSTQDLENDKFKFWNAFSSMEYDKGHFIFEWNSKMIPHILELKEKYVTTDLTVTSKFKSGFSWTLYDYLRAHYGYWHKLIPKESLMKLFSVENRKTYQNTAQFKRGVLDVAIAEINKFTELDIRYEEEKEGRAIVGFDLIWSTGTNKKSATKKQIKELRTTVDTVIKDSLVFVDLNDEKNRQRAINIVKEIKEMLPHTTEPICITYEKANDLISKANDNLKELNKLLEKEKGRDTSFYYNWLDE